MFIKRFWGFGSHWPVLSFGKPGSLTSLLSQSAPGDVMAFVGTTGDQTAPHERGRLLGFAEFGRTKLHSREALPGDVFAKAQKGSNGDIKWPHAVVLTRAWKIDQEPLPLLTDVLGRQLPMAAISNAILLPQHEQSAILALPRTEFDVALTRAIWDERERIAQLVGPGGTLGPIPTSFTTQIKKDALQPASTYAFRFGGMDVWKVGWANDPKERLRDLNKHVPSEVLDGACWGGGLLQSWATAQQAYAMEQCVLASFPDTAKFGERVHCSKAALEAAWLKALRG